MTSDCSLAFPPHPAWVRAAREAVRTLLTAASRTELTDTALVLTSEAVTNAVNACRTRGCTQPVTLLAEWTDREQLLVLVHDDAPGTPTPRTAAPDAESGRGLMLIESGAEAWGVCTQGGGPGKATWFTLGAPVCGECVELGGAQRRAVDSGDKRRAVATTAALRRHVHGAHPQP
ncbi:ATP-binding protein [Streptomyces sp. NPDC049577]|uniref:ATP-binding protein n=1 Tax=Streptomyces sp. NPDC049577 TaxID=3155153 RepID=UPI003435B118